MVIDIPCSERLLGPAPEDFVFQPKHKANSFEVCFQLLIVITTYIDTNVDFSRDKVEA